MEKSYKYITQNIINYGKPCDHDKLLKELHSFKGSSYQVGFKKVGNIAKEIESKLKINHMIKLMIKLIN